MKFEFNPNIPIYLQIIEEIKRQIVFGERKPGSKIESVRDLAQTMGVNPNTMQRAFAELERQNLSYTERTSGRFITVDVELIKKIKDESIQKEVSEFVGLMKKSGFHKSDILILIEKFMEESDNE
ncbi:GntR family transcriptional regulator [Clostridium lacusfryxellense]|uniref:GntR family transcriptional regulator n=1 Tax=Clostridium lacusfryxellense TaxID=205328 RepID=UPI001C0CC7C6|nr:GntR family transcriptional regulator [Clostridium lacusfryxellense]MBU3112239.1 GntR family transcriptional regulator [Clostridium lacusfryxellense]